MRHAPLGVVTIPEIANGMPDGIYPKTIVHQRDLLLGPCILGLLEAIAKLLRLPDI